MADIIPFPMATLDGAAARVNRGGSRDGRAALAEALRAGGAREAGERLRHLIARHKALLAAGEDPCAEVWDQWHAASLELIGSLVRLLVHIRMDPAVAPFRLDLGQRVETSIRKRQQHIDEAQGSRLHGMRAAAPSRAGAGVPSRPVMRPLAAEQVEEVLFPGPLYRRLHAEACSATFHGIEVARALAAACRIVARALVAAGLWVLRGKPEDRRAHACAPVIRQRTRTLDARPAPVMRNRRDAFHPTGGGDAA